MKQHKTFGRRDWVQYNGHDRKHLKSGDIGSVVRKQHGQHAYWVLFPDSPLPQFVLNGDELTRTSEVPQKLVFG